MSFGVIGAGLRAALEGALNTALRSDPASQQRLVNLAGKSVHLSITDLKLDWCIHLNYPLVLLDADAAAAASANSHLAGSLADFIGLGLKDTHSLNGSGVVHTGDIQLLNACLNLFKQLDLDLAGLVSQELGPLAGALVDQLKQLGDQAQQTLSKMPPFIGDYVQHELQLVPSAAQLDLFTQDIHDLRSRADRLAARIERLNARLDLTSPLANV